MPWRYALEGWQDDWNSQQLFWNYMEKLHNIESQWAQPWNSWATEVMPTTFYLQILERCRPLCVKVTITLSLLYRMLPNQITTHIHHTMLKSLKNNENFIVLGIVIILYCYVHCVSLFLKQTKSWLRIYLTVFLWGWNEKKASTEMDWPDTVPEPVVIGLEAGTTGLSQRGAS